MFELDQEFKTTTVNRIRSLLGRVDNIQEETGNVSRKMKV
jgi:hypothetical protein